MEADADSVEANTLPIASTGYLSDDDDAMLLINLRDKSEDQPRTTIGEAVVAASADSGDPLENVMTRPLSSPVAKDGTHAPSGRRRTHRSKT
jgi:hypothetical protein